MSFPVARAAWLSAPTHARCYVLHLARVGFVTLERRVSPMKYSLRKTPSHLHLTYKYGEASGGLLGRNLVLEAEGNVMTLEIDLSANLLARNKSSPWYLDAVDLASNYHKLRSLQCPDNLVRTRLIRAWEGVEQPRMRMRLILNPRGRYLYEVAPHSLFMGGIQLDVQAFLEDESETSNETETSPVTETDDPHRKHA